MERILLYVEDTPGMAAAVAWTLRLAKGMSCRVFALSVVNPDAPRRRDTQTSDAEERAWSLLYEIEDDAFQKNVRISLLLETGEPLQRAGQPQHQLRCRVDSRQRRLPADGCRTRAPEQPAGRVREITLMEV